MVFDFLTSCKMYVILLGAYCTISNFLNCTLSVSLLNLSSKFENDTKLWFFLSRFKNNLQNNTSELKMSLIIIWSKLWMSCTILKKKILKLLTSFFCKIKKKNFLKKNFFFWNDRNFWWKKNSFLCFFNIKYRVLPTKGIIKYR